MTLDELNRADSAWLGRELLACCHSERWANALVARRPFASLDDLLAASDAVWGDLQPNDWREAMQGHAPIGERSTSPHARARNWSAGEQATAQADLEAMRALVLETTEYAQRFGHIFLISASGKDATMMLDAVRERMHNSREVELQVAAEELRKIARLRLHKLLDGRAETQP